MILSPFNSSCVMRDQCSYCVLDGILFDTGCSNACCPILIGSNIDQLQVNLLLFATGCAGGVINLSVEKFKTCFPHRRNRN